MTAYKGPKHVFTRVNCLNDFVDDVPQSLYVEITNALGARILALSVMVEAAKAYEMSEFNYSAVWSTYFIDHDEDYPDEDHASLKQLIVDVKTNQVAVENPMLHVTEDKFYWEAVPKHADDSLGLRSCRIPLSVLASDADYWYIDE